MKRCAVHSCSSLSPFRIGKQIPLSGPELSFSLFTHLESVPVAFWELARASGDYFLQRPYLQLLEEHPPGVLQFSYLLFFHRGAPVGIAYSQLLEFRANEHIRQQEADVSRFRSILAAQVKLKVLICGNMLLTGQHAFYFLPDFKSVSGKPLREALGKTADHWRGQGMTINTILVKDFDRMSPSTIGNWAASEYHQLTFQPNMVLPLQTHWQSMEDYLDDLSSKYRVRYRRAQKKLQGVQCLELNVDQIRTYEPEIYQLYRNVAESSDFCVGYLAPQYFSEFKARDPEAFRLWGYFQSGALIGFCTTIRNDRKLEAHFLGLDEQQQHYQLYLNMLYQLIEVAIEERVDQLIFSRTAMEIKSSVGAIAIPTSVFLLHHTSSLINSFIPCLVDWLEPKEEWQARHPFRENMALTSG
jgi:hypothetical protein